MPPVLAATLVAAALVAATGSARASVTLRVPQDHPTIQAAIDAAAAGDTIVVTAGTYNENVIIDKSVSLVAESFDSSDPRNNTSILDGGGDPVITIRRGVLRVLRSPASSSGTGGTGLSPEARSPSTTPISPRTWTASSALAGRRESISDNVFEASNDDAIDINHPIRNFAIEDNEILRSGGDGIEIRLHDDAIANTVEIAIRGNEIVQSHHDGIQLIDYFEDTDRIFVIERNLIRDNGQAGIGMLDNGQSGEDFRAASIRERIHVFHNTFVGNDHGISGGDNLIALNNIFQGHVLALKNVDGDSIASYNLFWDNATDFQGSSVDPATTLFVDPQLGADDRLGVGEPGDRRRHRTLRVARRGRHGPTAIVVPGCGARSRLARAGGDPDEPALDLGLRPASGAPGTSVTISGSGFTNATHVRFNGTSAGFSIVSDTQITATVPSGATSGPISVTGPDGTGTSAASFSVTTAAAATVIVKDYAFKPKKLQVAQGQVVGSDVPRTKRAYGDRHRRTRRRRRPVVRLGFEWARRRLRVRVQGGRHVPLRLHEFGTLPDDGNY